MKYLLQKAIVLPILIALSIGAVVFKLKSTAPVEHSNNQYPVKVVEVITVSELPFRSRAVAYGHVEPSVVLKAKAEVSGKISYVHPDLKKGASLSQGTVVLRIEPTSFEFSLNQSVAALSSSQSSLEQLEAEEKSTLRLLSIAQENLAVGQKELNRLTEIWEKRLIARSSVDAEEQKLLTLQQQVADLQGKASTYASRRDATAAQIKQSETQVAESRDVLGKTEMRMPFDGRIGTVEIERGEYISVGSQLFEASGTQSVEIDAQLPVNQFRPLARAINQELPNLQDPASFQQLLDSWDLEVKVRLVGGNTAGMSTLWQGKLVRIGESVDPVRGTLSLIVAVDKPYESVVPGARPPLLQGMYTSVEFITQASPMLVVPRQAIHQGRVYVATADNKLAIRPIVIDSEQGTLTIVKSGLNEGEKIIISDVIPVMEGLPLRTIHATAYEEEFRKQAIVF
jgi:multidrug efflux pump subunit AcrA (membrane-fusion protein)